MSKIYLAFGGEYEYRTVLGVFTDKSNAEMASRLSGNDKYPDVEAVEVDLPVVSHPKGKLLYAVHRRVNRRKKTVKFSAWGTSCYEEFYNYSEDNTDNARMALKKDIPSDGEIVQRYGYSKDEAILWAENRDVAISLATPLLNAWAESNNNDVDNNGNDSEESSSESSEEEPQKEKYFSTF
jgi:hypothetical protein